MEEDVLTELRSEEEKEEPVTDLLSVVKVVMRELLRARIVRAVSVSRRIDTAVSRVPYISSRYLH